MKRLIDDERERNPFYSNQAVRQYKRRIKEIEATERRHFKGNPEPSRHDTGEREETEDDE